MTSEHNPIPHQVRETNHVQPVTPVEFTAHAPLSERTAFQGMTMATNGDLPEGARKAVEVGAEIIFLASSPKPPDVDSLDHTSAVPLWQQRERPVIPTPEDYDEVFKHTIDHHTYSERDIREVSVMLEDGEVVWNIMKLPRVHARMHQEGEREDPFRDHDH